MQWIPPPPETAGPRRLSLVRAERVPAFLLQSRPAARSRVEGCRLRGAAAA